MGFLSSYKRFFFITALLLSGCSSDRAQYQELPYCALETAREKAKENSLFEESQWIPEKWWSLFQDEQLTAAIEKTLARNPTLQEAHANILLAAATADRVRSSLFPYIWWGGDLSRQKLSETGIVPFGSTSVPLSPSSQITEYFTLYETQLNLTYQFDVWGKNRNLLRAAISEVQANLADRAFIQLQLSIAVARIYFQLQIDYEKEEIAKALVNNRETYLQLIKKRVENHLDSDLDLHEAEESLALAQQTLLRIEADIAMRDHQLKAYLAGCFDEAFFNIHVDKRPLPRVPLPRELPLHLIAHRPDITAQLWLIESAGRHIDVAKAGFYPDFNITAFFGFQTIHFQELLKWPSTYFNVDPAFTLPLFDAGMRVANLRHSEVNYDLAIFHYNELVLNAAKEVLDGIVVLQNSNDQWLTAKKVLSLRRENHELTFLKFKNNIDSSFDVLIDEEEMLNAHDKEILALGNTFQAILSLIQALGGGYEVCVEY